MATLVKLHRVRSLVEQPPEWLEICAGVQAILWSIGQLFDPFVHTCSYHSMITDTAGVVWPWVAAGSAGAVLVIVAAFLDDGTYRAILNLVMSVWWVLVAYKLAAVVGGSPAVMVFIGIGAQNALAAMLLMFAGCLNPLQLVLFWRR